MLPASADACTTSCTSILPVQVLPLAWVLPSIRALVKTSLLGCAFEEGRERGARGRAHGLKEREVNGGGLEQNAVNGLRWVDADDGADAAFALLYERCEHAHHAGVMQPLPSLLPLLVGQPHPPLPRRSRAEISRRLPSRDKIDVAWWARPGHSLVRSVPAERVQRAARPVGLDGGAPDRRRCK
jgi:hypothetical protein